MAYSRREIHDFKTVITAALYNNLQDGIEELFKQISLVNETGIPKLMVFPLFEVATEESQTVFPINLNTFDEDTDTVFVHSGRTTLAPEQDYIIENNTIVLNEGVPKGRTILIYIFKNVPIGEEGSVSGSVIADKTLPLKKLAEMPSAEDVGARPDDWMPTAEQVGALTLITTMDELGLEYVSGTTTMEDLIEAMPDNSMFVLSIGTTQATDGFAPTIGTLSIIKLNNTRVDCRLVSKYGNACYYASYASDLTPKFTGWLKYIDEKGGTLSGPITINNANGLYTQREINSALYRMQMYVANIDGGAIGLQMLKDGGGYCGFFANGKSAHIVDGTANNKKYYLYGEHNKPSGSYTGNGSATERRIATGGIGNTCYIYGTNGYACHVDNEGAVSHADTNTNIVALLRKELRFVNGEIIIATTNDRCNENGKTFYWEVK